MKVINKETKKTIFFLFIMEKRLSLTTSFHIEKCLRI